MRSAMFALAALGVTTWAAPDALAQKGDRGGPNASSFGWLGSLAQGKTQARQTGKPLMVVIRCVP